jgi:hypothetical protein
VVNQISQDAILMQQMLSVLVGGGRVWLEAAFLLGLFAAALFKPHDIHNVTLFRRSYYLFGFSILVPPCLVLLMAYVIGMAGIGPGSTPTGPLNSTLMGPIIAAVGPILLGISIICALGSLVPSFIPPPEPPLQPLPGPRNRPTWRPSSSPEEPTFPENEG